MDRQSDSAEFTGQLAGLRPQMRSFALRMLAHPEDAEDAVQDTMLKAMNARRQFRAESSLKTWAFSILTRTCLDQLRQRRRYTWDAQVAAKQSPDVDHRPLIAELRREDAMYDAREHLAFCFSCVGRTISPEESAAVLLKEVMGFTNREAAKVCGTSESVHRHRLSAGRRAMRDVFDDLCGLVSKKGVCYQCSELRDKARSQRGGGPELSGDREGAFDSRVAVARDADLADGASAALHRIMFRAVRQVGEQATMSGSVAEG